MSLGNIGKVLLLFIFVIALSSCNNDNEEIITKYTVSLYNGEELIEVIENIEENTLIELPVLEEDGMLFVGYEVENLIYYDEYMVISDISIYASFEVVTDVFEYIEFENEPTIGINGYNGSATHLKIPQMINGKVVSAIKSYAFEESNLIEVIIPVDAYVNSWAFINSVQLKKVSFYGRYLIVYERVIGNLEYDEIIAENSDTCIIIEGSIEGESWVFSDGSITSLAVSFGAIDKENFKIYVPDDSIDEYLGHLFWEDFNNEIHPKSEYSTE